MRYFYVALAVAGAVLLIVLLLSLLIHFRRRRARKKVCSLCAKEKCCRLNGALDSFGFCYEEKDDSISSRMYPWQRQMGYCRAYDEAAIAMNMVMDCEPVYFHYSGRRYLIEFWKGQYGCATGAEIGVYVNRSGDFERPSEELFYECVEDEECLPMRFTLIKDGKVVLQRNAVHWWLTGFRPGMLSWPQELRMDASISFPNAGMCRAFCEGLLRAGYEQREIRVEKYTVFFSFSEPCTGQPCRKSCSQSESCNARHTGWYCRWVMGRNRRNCRRYCRATRDFCSTLDRISYLGFCFPVLYRILVHIGVKCSPRRYRRYKRRNSR